MIPLVKNRRAHTVSSARASAKRGHTNNNVRLYTTTPNIAVRITIIVVHIFVHNWKKKNSMPLLFFYFGLQQLQDKRRSTKLNGLSSTSVWTHFTPTALKHGAVNLGTPPPSPSPPWLTFPLLEHYWTVFRPST